MMNKAALLTLFMLTCMSCKHYSFTGASISADVKTASISFFPNRAAIVNPSLSQQFTEKLRDKFISETNLTLVQQQGDLHFEGAIVEYRTQPSAIQGNDNAALNRLTITVNVKFSNLKEPKNDFDQNFSRYVEFDSQVSLASVEQDLVDEINKQLVDDIFNKAVINW
jgi:hypothetical protein